ncbi:polysaccharide lyase family 8 super-sandwich domain-containing protein [Pedobacter arcticus]|uniref:polysaccharide lyase family 8 super-sandwich domain-containing protein n=1 Tax=Pedobacter arcticus TaxID=752140 RepID=UPI0002D9363E|nr:polysaccharide lyase family 8 super-sandwich domain-containing protein [Pedobacter arcticus]
MRKTLLLLLLLFFSVFVNAQTRFTDFESGVPSYFSTDASISLTTSGEHVKSGTKAIKWVATDNKKIMASSLNIPSGEVGSATASSAQLYVYSSEANNDQLIFEFLDNSGVVQRTGTMLLNFVGWRDYHRSYRYDYNNGNEKASFNLNQCRITYKKVAPAGTTRTLFFDNFTFIGNTEIRQPGPHMALDYQHFKIESPQDPLGAYLKKSNVSILPASIAELSSLAIVKSNYTRNIGSVTPTAVTAAKTYVTNCGITRNPDNSIKGKGILETNDPTLLVLVSTHIQSLARAFLKNNDTDAKDKLLLFTEYIIDQGISEGGRNDLATNSYDNARKFPLGFLEALSIYPEPLRTDVINLLKWSHEYNKIYELNPTPGQNTDFVHIKLTFLFETACALTSNNEAVSDLKYLKNFLERNTDISQGFRDGIKPDGTGFHHQSHQMSYMYAFATWVDRAYALKGTAFKISQGAYDNMAFAYKSIFLESSKGGVYANSESGRTPFPTKIPINDVQFRRLVEIGGDIIGEPFEPEMAALYNYTYSVSTYATPAKDYDGFYAYNYANLGVKKSGNWTAVMKGLTSYLFGTEIYPTQNRYGRYQSYGSLEILYNGTLEDSGYILNGAGWDWNYMPGATTVVLPFNKLQAQQSRADEYQVNDFAGALSLGKNGIFGIDFQQRNTNYYTTSNLKFKKSVFAFDNILICLGSDISVSNNQGSVVSNLFQTVSTTAAPTMNNNSTNPEVRNPFASSYSLATNYKWLTSSQGTGFYLPAGNDSYKVELGTQTTPDYTSLTGAETNTANFTRAYLIHGNQPLASAPAKYEYVVAPGVTPTEMKDLATTLETGNVYTVLNQTADFHAIKYIPENTTAYVFFKYKMGVNVGLVTSVSEQALINVKEYDTDKVLVTINNPNLNAITNSVSDFVSSPQTINLGLTGNYTVITNPNSASVNQTANTLYVGFTVKDGFASSILLQKSNVTPIKLLDFIGTYQSTGIKLNWTSVEEKNVKKFVLYRSDDGLSFEEIATVNASGNSSIKTTYNHTDANFAKTNQTLYYKLQTVDADGTISDERTTTVKLPFINSQIQCYPNPVSSFINVSFRSEKEEKGTITVYALNGQLRFKKDINIKMGLNLFPVFLEELNTGEYIIKVTTEKIKHSQKFIKL